MEAGAERGASAGAEAAPPPSPPPRSGGRRLARALFSAYAWAFLVTNTLSLTLLGLLLTPLLGGRRAFGFVVHRWARANLRAGGYEVVVHGAEGVPRPAVLAANHGSSFDILLLAGVLEPPLVFVSRRENLRLPVIGVILALGGHPIVDRGAGEVNAPALDRAIAALEGGGRVVFFAEGSRSRDGAVRPFKSGAFRVAARAGCPLVPVAVAGTRHVRPRGSWHLLPARVALSFLPATRVADEESHSLQAREEVRARVAAEVAALEPETRARL